MATEQVLFYFGNIRLSFSCKSVNGNNKKFDCPLHKCGDRFNLAAMYLPRVHIVGMLFKLQWNLSFGTPLFKGHQFRGHKFGGRS